jgi:predicted RNA-binding Zn ribbon-like protein
MTALEVVEAVEAAGITLSLDAQYRLVANPPGRLTDAARDAIKLHKGQLKSVIRLRAIHRAMGFSPEDVLFIERALLSGRVSEMKIAVPAPLGVVAWAESIQPRVRETLTAMVTEAAAREDLPSLIGDLAMATALAWTQLTAPRVPAESRRGTTTGTSTLKRPPGVSACPGIGSTRTARACRSS